MSKLDKPTLSPKEYLEIVEQKFLEAGDPARAEQQRAYMRDQFDYYGIRAPLWLGILKTTFDDLGTFSGKPMQEFLKMCYQQEYREMHYAGLEMMQVRIKTWPSSWIKTLEFCITTNSWW